MKKLFAALMLTVLTSGTIIATASPFMQQDTSKHKKAPSDTTKKHKTKKDSTKVEMIKK